MGHMQEKNTILLRKYGFFQLTIAQFFMYAPKYLSIAQFLLNSCITFPAGYPTKKNCILSKIEIKWRLVKCRFFGVFHLFLP